MQKPPETDYSIDYEESLCWNGYDGQELLENFQKLLSRLQHLLKEKLLEDILFNIVKVVYREFLFLNSFSMNLKSVREELSYLSFDNGSVGVLEYDTEGEFFSFDIIEKNLDELKKFAEQGNMDAIAIFSKYYLYLANQIAPYGRDGSNFGAVWDNQKMKYMQTEQSRLSLKKFDDYIATSNKYQKMMQSCPLNINDVDLEQADIAKVQLKYLANQGDLEAIEYILYHELFDDQMDAWTYIYVAQALGKDFTRHDLRAYNSYTGEPYDDYGPMEIAGREAIQSVIDLSKLSGDDNEQALKCAQDIFQKIKQSS